VTLLLSRFLRDTLEPPHVRIAGGENAIRQREARVLLDRKKELWWEFLPLRRCSPIRSICRGGTAKLASCRQRPARRCTLFVLIQCGPLLNRRLLVGLLIVDH